MRVLRTILSVLVAWSLLGVLMVGLGMLVLPLQSIRRNLEKIVWGVRAMEQQMVPLGSHADALTASLGETSDAVDAAAEQLAEMSRGIDAAGPAFRAR